MRWCKTCVGLLDADLLVYTLLLLLDLFLEVLDRRAVWCRAVGLEDLDISAVQRLAHGGRVEEMNRGDGLISQRGDLLLFYLVICEVLLVFLPVLAGSGRLKQWSVELRGDVTRS